jgi:hypothetical protein
MPEAMGRPMALRPPCASGVYMADANRPPPPAGPGWLGARRHGLLRHNTSQVSDRTARNASATQGNTLHIPAR